MVNKHRLPGDAGAIFDVRGPVSGAVAAKLGKRITALEAVIAEAIKAIEEGRRGDALKVLRAARRQDQAAITPPRNPGSAA